MRTDDLYERRRPREDVRHTALRDQGRDARGRGGAAARAPTGRRLAVRPEYDAAVTRDLRRYFDEYACVALENYGRSRRMKINGVAIADTFAEAFTMRVARIVITGRTAKWAREAAIKLTGFATSVIGCKCEAGIERELTPADTPDGRPGSACCFSPWTSKASRAADRAARANGAHLPHDRLFRRPSDAPDRLAIGKALRVFGDGFQASKIIGGKRYWRLPVMEGEFVIEEAFGC